MLSNLVSLERNETPADVSHTNVQPVFDIYANVQGADLGRVSDQVTKIVNEFRPKLPPGSTINVRGQVESMNSAFSKLGLGLIFVPLSTIAYQTLQAAAYVQDDFKVRKSLTLSPGVRISRTPWSSVTWWWYRFPGRAPCPSTSIRSESLRRPPRPPAA